MSNRTDIDSLRTVLPLAQEGDRVHIAPVLDALPHLLDELQAARGVVDVIAALRKNRARWPNVIAAMAVWDQTTGEDNEPPADEDDDEEADESSEDEVSATDDDAAADHGVFS
jgi:hypothetical protein